MAERVPRKVQLAVCERDGWQCFRCGLYCQTGPHSVHHRVLGNRADNRFSNLILLCGSGTLGCHAWVHHNPREAMAHGYIVTKFGSTPTWEVPVTHFRLGRVLLDDEGGQPCPAMTW